MLSLSLCNTLTGLLPEIIVFMLFSEHIILWHGKNLMIDRVAVKTYNFVLSHCTEGDLQKQQEKGYDTVCITFLLVFRSWCS